MNIADKIRKNQNEKEMTRKAIKILESMKEDVDDLKVKFFEIYGENV